MPVLLEKAQFTVNDKKDEGAGGGGSPDHRVFVFQTDFAAPAGGCTVTIRFSRNKDNDPGLLTVTLPPADVDKPIAIPTFNGRIKPEGILMLKIDAGTRIVLFSGKLHTRRRASMLKVCVAATT